MWLDSCEGSTSMVDVLKNTLCKFGGSEVAAPSSNYPCIVLVMPPEEIQITGSLQDNFQTDHIKLNTFHRMCGMIRKTLRKNFAKHATIIL
jgi:hypothetical protein